MLPNNSSCIQETCAWLPCCVDICVSQMMYQSMPLTHWWPMWLCLTIKTMTCCYTPAADAPAPVQVQVQYIKGLQMDWAINDGLDNQFKTWKILFNFILWAKLEALSEAHKSTIPLWWSETRGWNYTSPGEVTMMTLPCRQSGINLRNIVIPKLMTFVHGMTC